MIAALLAYFSGLILSTIVRKDKQNFEIKLNRAETKKRGALQNADKYKNKSTLEL